MPLTLWYVSKYVTPPSHGSAGARGYLLMKALAQLGHQAVIITSDSNQLATPPQLDAAYLRQEMDGLELWWVRTMKYSVAKSLRRILSWLDFEWRLFRLPKHQLPPPDVVVVSSLSLLTIVQGLFWRRRYKCRLVFEIRDIWPLTITEEGGFSPRNPLVLGLAAVEWLGYKYADAIVGTMPNLGEHVRQVLGHDRPTHCIPMGIDEAAYTVAQALPAEYVANHLPHNPFVVAHVGSIGITNALDTFLQCAERMAAEPHIHFLVVGDGDLRETYRARYGHLPNLTFAPKVPKAMVPSVLSRCDLLYFAVHPSQVWRYGQSLNKLIDYMMAGKPVLASYTGYPSMVNEANCGSFVPANDRDALEAEIRRYASMPASEREAMGTRGRDWLLQHRRYPKLAQDYLTIIQATPAPI